MAFTCTQGNYENNTKVSTVVSKITFVMLFMTFGAIQVHCEERIPFCKDGMEKLEYDEKDWRGRCFKADGQILDSACCEVEKNYLRERKCMQSRMCFFKGKNLKLLHVWVGFL